MCTIDATEHPGKVIEIFSFPKLSITIYTKSTACSAHDFTFRTRFSHQLYSIQAPTSSPIGQHQAIQKLYDEHTYAYEVILFMMQQTSFVRSETKN
ncbi:hypothetical protein QVD17_21126 [Tagetes erecta]|uniref:Uncharacterized protein n=1 Tax=Tagetes erecta TaxID=13708 RepID=A0AAD8KQF3_TARER|nr:hypothetical protein QVD17_21126 [Tagetes erecta]